MAGYSLMTETEGASFGMGMINLTPWDQREQTAAELMSVYADRVAHIKDADIQFFLPPTVPGFGNASGFELRLQDKTAGTFAELDEVEFPAISAPGGFGEGGQARHQRERVHGDLAILCR